MTDRLFTDCCYGTDQQHAAWQQCPRDSGSDPQGENAGTAVEAESSQSGGTISAASPETTLSDPSEGDMK